MQEINCPRCGEPWDIDTIHEEVDWRTSNGLMTDKPYEKEFHAVQAEFYSRGCVTFEGVSRECERTDSFKAMASEALYDILGDDIDGIAAMLEDANE